MQKMTSAGVWARGILTVGAAMLAYLQADSSFQSMASAQTKMLVGLLTVGAIALRGFLDQSSSQAQAAQAPLEVTNVPGDKIEVTTDDTTAPKNDVPDIEAMLKTHRMEPEGEPTT